MFRSDHIWWSSSESRSQVRKKNDADRILNKTALPSRIVIVFFILILLTLISVPAMVHSQLWKKNKKKKHPTLPFKTTLSHGSLALTNVSFPGALNPHWDALTTFDDIYLFQRNYYEMLLILYDSHWSKAAVKLAECTFLPTCLRVLRRH